EGGGFWAALLAMPRLRIPLPLRHKNIANETPSLLTFFRAECGGRGDGRSAPRTGTCGASRYEWHERVRSHAGYTNSGGKLRRQYISFSRGSAAWFEGTVGDHSHHGCCTRCRPRVRATHFRAPCRKTSDCRAPWFS